MLKAKTMFLSYRHGRVGQNGVFIAANEVTLSNGLCLNLKVD